MNHPDFAKLTTAEKLKDSNYRDLIYQTYPDEPTCTCKPVVDFSRPLSTVKSDISKPPNNFAVCPGGCEKSCCTSVKQQGIAASHSDNANKNDKVPRFMPTYCVGNFRDSENECYEDRTKEKKAVHNGDYCSGENRRLRGGGEGGERRGREGMYPQSREVNEAMVRRFDDAWNGTNGCVVNRHYEDVRVRAAGGGATAYEYIERHPVNRSVGLSSRCIEENPAEGCQKAKYRQRPEDSHLDRSNSRNLPNAYSSSPYQPAAAGCCCSGREILTETTRQDGNSSVYGKKPCPGVNSLIKVFHETQDFVESLGKVPGLAGLGLMDPTDSPYFGRARIKVSNSDTPKVTAKPSGLAGLPNPQCIGTCNAEMSKATASGAAGRFGDATSFTIAVPGRTGVVREAVPSFPGPEYSYATNKSRKRDDKEKLKETNENSVAPADNEHGPCGEMRCKAKRQKNENAEVSPAVESIESPIKTTTVTLPNMNGPMHTRDGNKVKATSKLHHHRHSLDLGSGGIRTGKRRSTEKSGKKQICFVYSAGDAYSEFTCGHKNCIEKRRRVPGNMGWLWNHTETVGNLKPRPGWTPGAIGRHLNEILREAKATLHGHQSSLQSLRSTASRSRAMPSRGKRSRSPKDRLSVKKFPAKMKEDDKEELEPPPTLHIHRKDGTYYVTMYPIKQDVMDVPKLEEPIKPLQFKIAKNKDDASVASSSTASDMEIEFSPPAAVNRYRKKPNVIHVETQVKQQEITDAFKNDDAKKEKKKGKKGKK